MSKKYSIVIIDDEVEIIDMLSRFLSRNQNFAVQTFSNPVSALSSLNSTKCDLVLLDIMMPQMNGLDVLEKLKDMNILSEDAIIIVEASIKTDFDYLESLGYSIWKEKIYKTNKFVTF